MEKRQNILQNAVGLNFPIHRLRHVEIRVLQMGKSLLVNSEISNLQNAVGLNFPDPPSTSPTLDTCPFGPTL